MSGNDDRALVWGTAVMTGRTLFIRDIKLGLIDSSATLLVC